MFEEPAYQWRDPAWRQSAEGWIHEALTRLVRPAIGPITGVRFLPWSAVLRASTASGDYYFKQCGPSQAHEPALAEFLAAARPDCMIALAAIDRPGMRFLMPDGGPTLTAAISAPRDGPAHWQRVLTLMADVQREMIPRADFLLGIGVPDRRPGSLPGLFCGLLTQPERLRVGAPGGLAAGELLDLESIASRFELLCEELAGLGLPDTYVQDDLHEDHIFVARGADGTWRYTFFDYGDACVGHPFLQLVSRPRFAGKRYGFDGDRVLAPLFDVYMAHWQDFAPHNVLRRALDIALALGGVVRAMTWITACHDYFPALSPELLDAYTTGVAFWLRQVQERVERLDDR